MFGRVASRSLVALLAALLVIPVVPATAALAAEVPTVAVTSTNAASTYGDSVTFTASVSGGSGEATGTVQFAINTVDFGDPAALASGSASSLAIDNLPVGTHAVSAHFESGTGDYESADGALSGGQAVAPRTLTVAPDPKALTYRSPIPSYTFAVTGFVLDEDEGSAAGYADPTCTSSYTPTTPVSSSPLEISCSGGTATNYSFAYETAQLTIGKANQTISFTSSPPSPATVGGTYTPGATATPSGLPVGFTIDPSAASVCSFDAGVVHFDATGQCKVNANQDGDGNYNEATQVQQQFSIGVAATTTTLVPSLNPSTYNQSVTFTATVTPPGATGTVTFKDGATTIGSDTLDGSGTASFLTAALSVATHSITAVYGGDAGHAESTSATVSQVVAPANQAALTITGPAAKTYGDLPFIPTTSGGTTGGAVTFASSTPAVCTATDSPSVTIVAAGLCTITATMAGNTNYESVTSLPYAIAVNPRPITVTADAKTKTYGDADPALTYQITSGTLVGSDSLSGSLTRVAGENVGTRTIQLGTLTAGTNYAITFVGASLTITQATLTVTADDKSKTYGAANPAPTVQYSGFKLGDTLATSVTGAPAVTTTATTTSHVGTYPINVAIGSLASGNYTFTFVSGELTVEKKLMTVTASSETVTYGATPPTIDPQYDTAAWVGTDKANDLNTRPTCSSDYDQYDPAGGTYTSTCSGGVDNDYSFGYVPGTVTVNKKSLAVTADAKSRPYGSANPALTFAYSGFVGTDDAGDIDTPPTCSTTAITGSPVATYPITCSGGSDVNYAFTYTGANLSVTKAPLTVTADNKSRTYGAANPAFTATITGFVNGETLATSGVTGAPTCSSTATSTSPAGSYAITCVQGGLTAVNYSFGPFVAGTLSVGQASLTITANNASRTYGDANPTFSASYGGFVAGDDAGDLDTPPICTSAATATTPAGTAPITCSGATDANYVIGYVPGTLTINKRALVVTATGNDKEYDGTTSATVTLADNRVNADTLTVTYASASFATAAVGNGKTVTVTGIDVTGADAGNYTFNTTASTTADITKRSVTPSASAPDKVYDGTTAAPGTTCSLSGVLTGDTVTCAGTAAFGDKNVGTNKTVTLGGITLGGAAAGNYALSTTTTTTQADITKRPLTVTATGVNKVYDGDIDATVNLASDKLAADTVTAAYTGASFLDKNVATGKLVNVAGISIGGSDAGNYSLQNTTAVTAAAITKATLTVTATASNKVYDASTAAAVALGSDKIGGDTVVIAHTTAAFNTKHVGTNKLVTVLGIGISGADAGNYQLASTTAATTANIAVRPITVTAVTATKVYDGTTAAAGTPTITSAITLAAGDTVTWTQAFLTKTAGTGKTIAPAGTVSDGNSGNNYAVAFVNNTSGAITAKALTVTGITSPGKVYDGTTTAALSVAGATLVGRVAGDTTTTLVTTGATGAFADKNVGVGKTVTVAGLTITGIDAPNYTLTQPTTTATITKAPLTVAAESKSRPYGSDNPALTVAYSGFVGGETLATSGVTGAPTCSTVATVADGIGDYPITCTSGTLAAANYAFTVNGGTLRITPAPLTLTALDQTRQYGLPNPTLTSTVTGFVNDETAGSAGLSGAPICTTTALVTDDVGTRSITCTAGTLAAPNYAVTTLVPGTLTITQAIAAPAVTSTVNPAVASQDVTISATVTWPTGTPTGTVTFFEGVTAIAGPLPLVGGIASFNTSWEAVTDEDAHDITAVYSGDGGNFAQAEAAPFRQVVGKSAVEVVVTSDRATWETSVPVKLTADVHPLATGVTRPVAGTVAFRVDGVLKATVPVVAGAASHTTVLALGTRSVVAAFTPDVSVETVFKPGTSTALTKTVVANTVNASSVGVSSSSVYPVKDTWKDTVAIRGTRNEAASVSIKVYRVVAGKDPLVKSVSLARTSGTYEYNWNGRRSGRILPAGKYKVVQLLTDAFGAKKKYVSYVTLSTKKMTWYTKTITVSPGPRNYQVRSTDDTSILSAPSTKSTSPLVMSNATSTPAWIAAGYQFTLPSASTYTSLSFQARGSWTDAVDPKAPPKIGLIPWNGGDWGSIYSKTRARMALGTSSTTWYAQTITNLTGIRSGRSVRAAVDTFYVDGESTSGYATGPFRYSITGVRLVVKYGILK